MLATEEGRNRVRDRQGNGRNSFLRRRARGLARAVSRPIRGVRLRTELRQSIRAGLSQVGDLLRPRRTSLGELLEGYKGRHADGGRARFAAMVEAAGLDGSALDRIAGHHRRTALVFQAGAAAFVVAGVVVIVVSDRPSGIAFGAGTCLVSLLFTAMAIQAGYKRWAILNRRFGGLGEYLSGDDAPETRRRSGGRR